MSKNLELQRVHNDNFDQEQNKTINNNLEDDEQQKLQGTADLQSIKIPQQEDIAESYNFNCYERLLDCLGNCAGTFRTWLPCICCFCPMPYFQTDFGNIALVEKFGKLFKVLKEGYHKYNPFTDKYHTINMKTQLIDLQRQVVLTNDNITLNIDAIVYYRIVDPIRCQYRLQDSKMAVEEIVIAALRAVCGEYTMQQLLEQRDVISEQLEKFIFQEVKNWGIYVEQAFIKDIILSKDLAFNLAAVGKARRIGEAKVISADADVKCAKMLREAADLLDSDAAMQMRYFEQLQALANNPVPKVMFLPLNDKQFKNQQQ
ncbi:hypothetical protein PPERSA_05411 [Pseudocohnilembus persalinus]|uniref:Band 7 domain-containing protein n=1 Tax=Pseudocohnilembus persalinus TaxID=266149 RepID=A0A0V0R7W8_PSEPJ|nr:hypothetical protein PPERSA_05411 [Pseudocohnilembus persalinus]|eukprot:KRX10591.1 hypothetical protein PPERSA_05411 [Pseudocohnilembus persalinus]